MDNLNINGIILDDYQMNAIKAKEKSVLLIAGAGSGKTLTIEGKIKYLIEYEHIKEEEILCISFTNETVNNLYTKLNSLGYEIEVKTFHKLGMKYLSNFNYSICDDSLLPFITDEYFKSYIKYNKNYKKEFKSIFKTFKNIDNLLSSYEYTELKKTILTFIKLSKANNIPLYEIYKKYKHSFFITKVILKYILEISKIYENELKSSNKIDMDDIIIKGTECIKNYPINYKYIIIDEFQDSSIIRLNLIRELIRLSDASLFAVGDDYQSIYGFSGSNLDIFINFKNYFKDAKYYYLKYTYRNSNELIFITVNFIMKNKHQLKKNISSIKSNSKPIKILFNYTVEETIKLINSKEILILGRNNSDIDKINYENKLTIHKSKGLECENIILVNSDNIPSKIKNNNIINLINKTKIYIPYEEERRLFYVALTRTKNNIYILVNKPSIFIKELMHDYMEFIEIKKKGSLH